MVISPADHPPRQSRRDGTMNDNWKTHKPNPAATYRVQVLRKLDESRSDWFSDMTIECENAIGRYPTTTLTGRAIDQAALCRILSRIWDLNLVLISVHRTECGESARPQRRYRS